MEGLLLHQPLLFEQMLVVQSNLRPSVCWTSCYYRRDLSDRLTSDERDLQFFSDGHLQNVTVTNPPEASCVLSVRPEGGVRLTVLLNACLLHGAPFNCIIHAAKGKP